MKWKATNVGPTIEKAILQASYSVLRAILSVPRIHTEYGALAPFLNS
jgi:hypothetical protein